MAVLCVRRLGVCGGGSMRKSTGLSRLGCFLDRKSTRLNSSHVSISYAVFCMTKKTKIKNLHTTPFNTGRFVSALHYLNEPNKNLLNVRPSTTMVKTICKLTTHEQQLSSTSYS